MNTTALGSRVSPAHVPAAGSLVTATRSTARDFLAGLLSVTKANLLSQQDTPPRRRRF